MGQINENLANITTKVTVNGDTKTVAYLGE
jgi:hypothetical protein